jgi:glutamine synthetase
MAKPYPDYSGSGLHMHFSVLDRNGHNIFDDGTEAGSALLRQAVAGCLDAMSDSALIFAPHANSYARMVPGAHAPTGICWAYENRTAAVRIPSGNPVARRVEHRVAGGDVNPYLTVAAILGAALNGIEDKMVPPDPITGNAYAAKLDQLPDTWETAIDVFEKSACMRRIFSEGLIRNYILTKRQELRYVSELSEAEQVEVYLDSV